METFRMNTRPFFRLAPAVLIAIALMSPGALAQAPAASTPAAPATPAPETPATAAPAAPAPATQPPAEAPATPPPAAAPVQTADPFGEEITLMAKTAVILKGSANWDSAFETLIDSFKKISGLIEKQGIKPAGNSMIV